MKKQVLALLCISVIVVVLLGGCTAMSENSKNEYFTANELKALFFENQELFEETAQMMLDNQNLPDDQLSLLIFDSNLHNQDFFTEEEKHCLQLFFQETKSCAISFDLDYFPDIEYEPFVEFYFSHTDDGTLRIFYIPVVGDLFQHQTGDCDMVEFLAENWYIGEKFPQPE